MLRNFQFINATHAVAVHMLRSAEKEGLIDDVDCPLVMLESLAIEHAQRVCYSKFIVDTIDKTDAGELSMNLTDFRDITDQTSLFLDAVAAHSFARG